MFYRSLFVIPAELFKTPYSLRKISLIPCKQLFNIFFLKHNTVYYNITQTNMKICFEVTDMYR
jgi:hypothetical protein